MIVKRVQVPLEIRAVRDDERVIEGVASTASIDRYGDIVEPTGVRPASFIPVLYGHDSAEPIGQVVAHEVADGGITATLRLVAAGVSAAADKAWALVKSGVLRGLSIGFAPIQYEALPEGRGLRFIEWEWLELSLVAIPANPESAITHYRSIPQETPMPDDVITKPEAPTKPLTPAKARLLSEAVQKSTLLSRLAQNGNVREEFAMRVKTMGSTQATGITGEYDVPNHNLGTVMTYSPLIARLLDLLPSYPVTGNVVDYNRVDYATGGNDSAAVVEGAAKPSSTTKVTPKSIPVVTYAHWIDVTKQLLDDVGGLRQTLDDLLRDGLLDNIDAAVYAALTTAGNFTAFTPGASETRADGIARIASQVATKGGRNIVVAVNPADLLAVSLEKEDTAGGYLGLPPNLAGRVVSVPTIAEGSALAFAPTGAGWGDREGVSVVAGWKNDDLTKNLVTLLCETRGAVLPLNPNHVAFGDLTDA